MVKQWQRKIRYGQDSKELIEKKEEKEKKITGEGVNNKKLIKVFPDEVKEEMKAMAKW